MAIPYGFENGRIVPTRELLETPEARKAMHDTGSSELLGALAMLRAETVALQSRYRTLELSPNFGKLWMHKDLPNNPTSRIPWVLEARDGRIGDKDRAISKAKKICTESGGQAVLILLWSTRAKPPSPKPRNFWDPVPPGPKVEVIYRPMLVAPRAVKIHYKKNGKRYLDWRPVPIEPSRTKEKLYHVPIVENYGIAGSM